MKKKNKKQKEEVYILTLKGLLASILAKSPFVNTSDYLELSNSLVEGIELYLRRVHSKKGHPGIVLNLDTNKFEFVSLSNKND